MASSSAYPGGVGASKRRGGKRGQGGGKKKVDRQQLNLDILGRLGDVNVSSFFDQPESDCVPYALYLSINKLDRLKELDCVQIAQRRLLLVEFYYLSEVLGDLEGRGSTSLCSYIEAFDKPQGPEANTYVKKSVKLFTQLGKRYQGFADDLGGVGTVFFLHEDIQRDIEQRIPESGEGREEFLNRLKEAGMLGYVDGIRDTADAILWYLRARSKQWIEATAWQQPGHLTFLPMYASSSQSHGGNTNTASATIAVQQLPMSQGTPAVPQIKGVDESNTEAPVDTGETWHGSPPSGRRGFFDVVLQPSPRTKD